MSGTMKELIGSVGGKLGGRGGKGRKRGGLKKKGDVNPVVRLGEGEDILVPTDKYSTLGVVGRDGIRWPGLSYPLPEHSKRRDWLQAEKLGIKRVSTVVVLVIVIMMGKCSLLV